MVWLILNIMLTLNFANTDLAKKNDIDETQIMALQKIDFSKDSIMQKIVADVKYDTHENKDVYLLVNISKYKKGYMLKVSETKENILPKGMWDGYSVINGDTIIITNIAFNYYMRFEEPRSSHEFKTRNCENPSNLSTQECYYFFILEDIYARFNNDNQWKWSDSVPDNK